MLEEGAGPGAEPALGEAEAPPSVAPQDAAVRPARPPPPEPRTSVLRSALPRAAVSRLTLPRLSLSWLTLSRLALSRLTLSRPVLSWPTPSRLALAWAAVQRKARALPDAYRDPFTWATAFVIFAAYGALSLFRLLQLHPTSWDLGIFTEYVKQYAHFHAPIVDIRTTGFNLLGDHFSPAVAVLAPFFRVFPSPATLLVAQALLVAASVFAVSRVARERLGVAPSRVIAVAYGFSWGLQQLIDFDFHELALAVPLLAFSLSAVARGRIKAAVWWALPLVFVKEDQGYTVAAIGVYLLVSGLRSPSQPRRLPSGARPSPSGARRSPNPAPLPGLKDLVNSRADTFHDPGGGRRVMAGSFLLAWGCVWSFVAIGLIIPHFNPAHHYSYWSDGGIFGPGGRVSVTGLLDQLAHAWPDKLDTVVMLLLPTAFTALGSPLILIAVPSLLLRFLSTNSSYWGTSWHYNATLMPILFIAAIEALARIQAAADAEGGLAGLAEWASGRSGPRRAVLAGARRYGAAMMLAITIPLAFQFPISNLWNAGTYHIGPDVSSADAAMAQVPDGATVLTTLDLLAPLAARTDTFWIGNSGNPETQYIVFDGNDSDYNPAIKDVPAFVDGFYPPNTYTVIFHSGPVYVFRHAP